MEHEDWESDRSSPRVDILIIDLADKAIQCVADVFTLQEEVESIREDYPEYNIVIFKLNGTA